MVFLYGGGDFSHYRAALEQRGQSVIISTELADAFSCDRLLLPGGGDIHGPLDEPEQRLIQYFTDRYRPILGICRGMQALNVWFGGTLRDFVSGHQRPEGDLWHITRAVDCLACALGPTPLVNSNHHQAVAQLGSGLIPCQWAADGILEGFCHESRPIWGVQWHPERCEIGGGIFDWFCREVTP